VCKLRQGSEAELCRIQVPFLRQNRDGQVHVLSRPGHKIHVHGMQFHRAINSRKMKLLRLNAENPEKDLVSYAAKEIASGKTIVYPTDTVYGLGCSIKSIDAVRKVFAIKKRDMDKPLSVAFPDLETAKGYVLLDAGEEGYIKKHLDEPFTFIVRKRENISDTITSGMDTVGIRIIDHPVVKRLIYTAKVPIVTTSANITGDKPPADFREIDKEILEKADLAIDSGRCRVGKPSKIINLVTGEILR